MRIPHLKSLFLILAATLACGKVRPAEEQPQGRLELPEFPTAGEPSFALAEGDGTSLYEGNLLLWDPRVTPPRIQAISEVSVQGRREKSRALALAAAEVLPVREALAQAKVQLEEASRLHAAAAAAGFRDPVVMREVTRPTASQWFDQRLEELVADPADGYVAANRETIVAHWQAYCDAKVWELATSRLANLAFAERPTPLQLCETYYASADPARGKEPYFQDQALCGPAATAEGRSYFGCLWREGVLKTPQFRYLENNPDEVCKRTGKARTSAEAIASWTEGEPSVLQVVFADEARRDRLAEAVLNAQGLIGPLGEVPAFKDCKAAFMRQNHNRTRRLDQASPRRLMAIGESDRLSMADPQAFNLIPRRTPPDEPADFANYDRLTNYVRKFGRRHQTATGLEVSVNDLLFNQPVGFDLPELGLDADAANVTTLQKDKEAIIPDDPSRADPAFRRFSELKRRYVQSFEEQKATAAAAHARALAAHDEKAGLLKAQLQAVQQVTVEGLGAVNVPEAVTYFSTFSLKLTRQGSRLGVTLGIAGDLVGCVDVATEHGCEAAGAEAPEGRPLKRVMFDREQNKLTLWVELDDLAATGFAPAPRTSEDLAAGAERPRQAFNDLPAERLQGRVVELVMYGNKLEGRLDFFTGEARVLEGERRVIEGALSGDRFDQSRREILADDQ